MNDNFVIKGSDLLLALERAKKANWTEYRKVNYRTLFSIKLFKFKLTLTRER